MLHFGVLPGPASRRGRRELDGVLRNAFFSLGKPIYISTRRGVCPYLSQIVEASIKKPAHPSMRRLGCRKSGLRHFSEVFIAPLRLRRGQGAMQRNPCYARLFADLPYTPPNPIIASGGGGPRTPKGFSTGAGAGGPLAPLPRLFVWRPGARTAPGPAKRRRPPSGRCGLPIRRNPPANKKTPLKGR